ncbi:methyltransferase domain-containing protein [Maridesulfovibrio sp.]|uniref:class I SAM-dependent methyltransferase n=1 Tax=Maridesulfovibrio sp. TaxID=2795000 RepID=UPI002A18D126|nr:methyltransferase domain-containing protein [Maridesulfovibrio sp.]
MKIIHVHNIPRKPVCNRHEFTLNLCKGKTVLHVGACDHPENVRVKYENGIMLHDKITHTAAKTIGIDINSEAIEECKKVGIDNIYYYDVMDPTFAIPQVDAVDYDICVFGDALQHIGDPRLFLVNLRRLLSPNTKVLVSVPNAFWIKNFFSMLRSVENCNSDQWSYYSPTTLRRTLEGAGYNFEDFLWHGKGDPNACIPMKARIKEKYIWKAFPHLADGIIAIASLR